jgi:hypothetical protein
MTIALRHSCRHCRTKLNEPTENLRRAFCARGCYRSFYRSRCRVCEASIRRKNEQQKVCYGKECKAELRRFPEAYSWPESRARYPPTPDARGASETLAKSASKSASNPTHK